MSDSPAAAGPAATSRPGTPEPPSTTLELKVPKPRSDVMVESKYKHQLKRSREASEEALSKYRKLSQGSAPESSRHQHALNIIESAITVLKTQQSEAALRVQSLTSVAEKAAKRQLSEKEVRDLEADIRDWTMARTSQEALLQSAQKQKNSLLDELTHLPSDKVQNVLEMLLCVPIIQKRTSRPGQSHWKKAAMQYYDVLRRVPNPSPSDQKPIHEIWDPILGGWVSADNMKAAHILPYSMTNEVLRMVLGEDDESEILYDIRNCLLLWAPLEAAFDKGAFVLVPVPTVEEDVPVEYKFVLLDESLRTGQIAYPASLMWGELDGKVLQFRNDCRPRQRYMYLNFASRIIAARKLNYDHYSRSRLESTGTAWVSPGKWIRRSLIREVARIVGDHQMPEVFEKGAFDDEEGPDSPTKTKVTKVAEDWVTETFTRQMFDRVPEKGEDDSDEE